MGTRSPERLLQSMPFGMGGDGQGQYAQPQDQYMANQPALKQAFGGAQGELANMQKGQFNFRLLFFVCGVAVFAAGVISVLDLFLNFEPGLTFVSEIYVTAFGAVMVVLDWPKSEDRVNASRDLVAKYLRFLTLFIGRGLTYLFLSTMVWSALHDNKINEFFAYIFGGFIFFVGVAAIGVGAVRSKHLQAFKKHLQSNPELVRNFSQRGPAGGLAVAQFTEMARSANFSFDEPTTEFIFDTLQGYPTRPGGERILKFQDLEAWLKEDSITLF